jgi:GMP synthase PP-ATPase subunit
MKLKIVEPAFKDEVRRRSFIGNYPELGKTSFPGPALSIRILGDINLEKVQFYKIKLLIDGLKSWDYIDKVSKVGAILLQ